MGESKPNPYDYYGRYNAYYGYYISYVRDFEEESRKLNEYEYHKCKSNDSLDSSALVQYIYNDEELSITTKLSEKGILLKEWSKDIVNL